MLKYNMLMASRNLGQSAATALGSSEADLQANHTQDSSTDDKYCSQDTSLDDKYCTQDTSTDDKYCTQYESTDDRYQKQSTNNLERNLFSSPPRTKTMDQLSLYNEKQEIHCCTRCCRLFPTPQCLKEHEEAMHSQETWQLEKFAKLPNVLPHKKNKKGSKITDIANKLLNLKTGTSVSDSTTQENDVLGLAENKSSMDTVCDESGMDVCKIKIKVDIAEIENYGIGSDKVVPEFDTSRDSYEININNRIQQNGEDVKMYDDGYSACKLCGFRFCHCRGEVTTVMNPDEDKPFKCAVCNTGFVREGNLLSHYRVHTGGKPYKCDVCGIAFSQRSNLRRHKRIHTALYPYKCDVCGVGFAETSNLKRHKRIHTGEKLYKCEICGVAFTECSNMKRHQRTHTKEKPFKCDICGVGFAVGCSLKTHRRIHTGEKPYTCDICGAGFAQSNNLKKHIWTHAPVKPFQCDTCGTGFSDRGSLKTHMRRHTGERPYTCIECGLAFGDMATLQRHRITHTGIKPFKCDVCEVAFTNKGNLNRHIQIHTKEVSDNSMMPSALMIRIYEAEDSRHPDCERVAGVS